MTASRNGIKTRFIEEVALLFLPGLKRRSSCRGKRTSDVNDCLADLSPSERANLILHLRAEYTEINQNIRWLADVRFKLLAFLPALSGIAIFLLSNLGIEAGEDGPRIAESLEIAVPLLAVLGFAATLGVTLYDQRNSQLYNALIHRAKYLERIFWLPLAPGGTSESQIGGQYSERPRANRRIFVCARHDLALAFVYGPVLGAWLFPLSFAVLSRAEAPEPGWYSAGISFLTAVFFGLWLNHLDRKENGLYGAAGGKAGLKVERTCGEPRLL